ncbi:outer membrane beta-barrel protein [Gemmatimonas sp.]|uniref:outer membrane beta-barrel protein n=1 Tax=Gemmatimonas sp. TaxID=1962908 RepID=UPI0033406C18
MSVELSGSPRNASFRQCTLPSASHPRRSTLLALAAATAVALCIGTPSRLYAQGVRFTLAPSGEYVWWDKKLGIEDGPLYGGRLGADFGSLVSLSGFYHLGTDKFGVSRDSLGAGGLPLAGPWRTNTRVRSYGGTLALRLSPARLAPFASVGAGVMRFEPDSAAARDQLNYRYGGGIQYDPTPNLRAMIMLEDSRFRLAPGQLYSSTLGGVSSSDRRTTRSNWTASASLGIAIGGKVDDDASDERWSMGSVPLEAFAGRLEFDDESIDRQALLGVRTGIDVGQYVGLRAFYWQGRSGDLRQREPIQSYGGEAQFNFTRSRGPSPFLVLGAGRLDFGKDFRDNAGRPRDAETALIAGAGVALRLSDNLRLNAAVRDYVRGPQDLDSVATTSQLTNNLMYTVGIGVDVGRSRRDMDRRDTRSSDEMLRDARRRDELRNARAEALRDGAEQPPRRMAGDAARRRNPVDTVYLDRDSSRVMRGGAPRPGERMIMLPVPTTGELYVRYGDSTQSTVRVNRMGASSSDSVRPATAATVNDSLVRALRAQVDSLEIRLRAPTRDPDSDAQIHALRARIDSMDSRVRANTARPPSPNVVVLPGTPLRDDRRDVVVIGRDTLMRDNMGAIRQPARSGMRITETSPYVAGFGQLVFGVMLDAGPVFGVEALRFVPDFALGVGSDPTISLAAGAQYDFAELKFETPGTYRPYVRAGLGFLAASGDRDSEFGVNVAYGVIYSRNGTGAQAVTDADRKKPLLFVEHQGINFFSTNRFLVGLRFRTR